MGHSNPSSALEWVFLLVLAATLFVGPRAAVGAQGDCAQPVSTGDSPTASDCLFILNASTGVTTCSPECVCDPNGDGGVTVTDALICLQNAVGEPVSLDCPCGLTTTSAPATTSTTMAVPPSVGVAASVEGDALPDASIMAIATIDLAGGCTVESIAWTQSGGASATIMGADTDAATVVLANQQDYKRHLIEVLGEPPIEEEDLPPNVPLPEGEFPGGLQNRYQVVGVNPFALEEAGLVGLDVTVSASCGEASDSVEVHTGLPWKPATSLNNVPRGVVAILHGRDHVDEDGDGFNDETGADVNVYDWMLSSAPAGSTAMLVDPTLQNPELTPDVSGLYTITVTDTTRLPGDEVVTLEVYAGTWEGAITGQDGQGRPLANDCTGCHDDDIAPDQFTPWKQSGHAEIFTDLLDTSGFYNPGCFACHTVGYDTDVDNGGIDEADDYEDFLMAGLLGNPGDNWTTMLADYPDAARLANIQCENCHGPQNDSAHTRGDPRVSISADVCAVCHGEPLRHARFQQWQLSGHANYELAIEEGESGNCSRCHTGNGFLTWLPILLDDDPGTNPVDDITVTWTADETHPQTCATCHDPHSPGSTSNIGTNATVRISGNTPPLIAGFTAFGVGRGAICMTCHNSRRGLRNDDTFDLFFGTSEAARAPHGSAQTDMIMGQNAYLVNVGIRGNHSFVEDTCVNCHMERTPPPEDLSYNLGGTNHTFFAADDICSDCHGSAFNATGVQEAFVASLEELQALVEDGIFQLMGDEIALGNVIVLDADSENETVISDMALVEDIIFGETRGRQAITVVFTDMTSVGPTGMNDIDVRDAINTTECPAAEPPLTRCELYDFADPVLIKSGWNYNLVNNDGSQGIHNPTFALVAIDAARDAMVVLLGL